METHEQDCLIRVEPAYTPSLESLAELRKQRLLKINSHPTLPLAIYNYTDVVQYKSLWTKDLIVCRGLALNTNTGKVVARPLTKFFTWGDQHASLAVEQANAALNAEQGQDIENVLQKLKIEEEPGHDGKVEGFVGLEKKTIPSTSVERVVYEKWDGSMILWFWFEDTQEWICTSRGSFESPQAVSGNKIARARGLDIEGRCDKNCTYMFELIDPNYRVRIDYGLDARLILLAVVETKTGKEMDLETEAERLGIEQAEEVPDTRGVTVEELARRDVVGKEGYVVRWPDGTRIKIKFKSYIFARLRDGNPKETPAQLRRRLVRQICFQDNLDQVLEDIDDERYEEVRAVMDEWKDKIDRFRARLEQILKDLEHIELGRVGEVLPTHPASKCECCHENTEEKSKCPELPTFLVCRTIAKVRKANNSRGKKLAVSMTVFDCFEPKAK